MDLGKSTRYAIPALIHLAGRERAEEPVMLRDIASAVNAPEAFLSKIFQRLRISGIVRSHRGVDRGYTLARPAADTSVYDILVATEGPTSLHAADTIAADSGAAFGSEWERLEGLVATRLRSMTLEGLARMPTEGGERKKGRSARR